MAVGEAVVNTAMAKAGVSVGLFGTAIIFTDPAFAWMAIAGSVMGLVSAFHTIFEEKEVRFSKMQITAILSKSFFLGLVSMPLLFFAIYEGVLIKLIGVEHGQISTSLSIATAFAGSWYFTPIVDSIVTRFRSGKDG